MCSKKCFTKLGFFCYQKTLANAICEKYLDEASNLAFMSSSCLFFKKNIFINRCYLNAICNISTSFGLWIMFQGAHDFCLYDKNLKANQQAKHVTIGLFETTKITTQGLARNLIKLLDEYGSRKKLTYVKNEGSNFNVRTIVIKSLWYVNVQVQRKTFKVSILTMLSLKLANM